MQWGKLRWGNAYGAMREERWGKGAMREERWSKDVKGRREGKDAMKEERWERWRNEDEREKISGNKWGWKV